MVKSASVGLRNGCRKFGLGTMMRARILGQKGFSLVEIAIVLVVVGLLVSGGLLGLAPVLDSSKITETNTKMDKIEQALVLYVIQNGCLPCPSTPLTAVTGSSYQGTSPGTAYTSSCGSGSTCTAPYGIVPWVSLGLSRDDVLDAYGDFIDYSPAVGLNTTSTSMVRTPPSTYPAPTTSIDIKNLAGTVQTNTTPNGAAYVLISHGKDKSYAYHPGNAAVQTNPNAPAAAPSAQGCNQASPVNCSGIYASGTFVQDKSQGTNGTGGYFDDIVRFKTAPVIVQSCGSNACGNPA